MGVGLGLPSPVSSCPVLPPAGTAAPEPDVPGQGSPCAVAERNPALLVCHGGDRLAAARREQAAAPASALVN